jgi:ABC-type nitrate/sulfonate/bicarbonate transport system substrate-binding protein
LATACSAQPEAEDAPQQLGTITAGTGIDASYTPFVVAEEKGFFEQHGVEFTHRVFETGVVGLDALLAGEVDLAGTGELPTLLARAGGGDVIIAGVMAESPTNFGLTARETIQQPQDLAGKRVGAEEGTGGQYWMERYIDHYGLDASEIDTVNVSTGDLVTAFVRGDIDAYFSWEPHVSTGAQEATDGHVLARSGEEDIYLQRLYLVLSESVAEDEALAEAVVAAMADTGAWIDESEENREEAAEITAQAFGMEIESAREQVAAFTYELYLDEGAMESLSDSAEWMLENGNLDEEPEWDAFVRPEFLEAAS